MRVSLNDAVRNLAVINHKDKFMLNAYNNLYICSKICSDKNDINSIGEYHLLSYLYMIALNNLRNLNDQEIKITNWYTRDRDIAAHQLNIDLSYKVNSTDLFSNVKECCEELLPRIEQLLKTRYQINDITVFHPNILSNTIADVVVPGDLGSISYISKDNIESWHNETRRLRAHTEHIPLDNNEIVKGFAYNMYCAQLLVSSIAHMSKEQTDLEYIATICQYIMTAGNLLNIIRQQFEDISLIERIFGHDSFISDIVAQRNIIAHSLFVNSLDKHFLVNINYYNIKLQDTIRDMYQHINITESHRDTWLSNIEHKIMNVVPKQTIVETNKKGKKKTKTQIEEIGDQEFENIIQEFLTSYHDKDIAQIDNAGLIQTKKANSKKIAEDIFDIINAYYNLGGADNSDKLTESEFNLIIQKTLHDDFDPHYSLKVHFTNRGSLGCGITLKTTNLVSYPINKFHSAANKAQTARTVEYMTIPRLLVRCKLHSAFNKMLENGISVRQDFYKNEECLYFWASYIDKSIEIFSKNQYLRNFMINLDYYNISAKVAHHGTLLEWAFINSPKFTEYLLKNGANFQQVRLKMVNIDYVMAEMSTSFCIQADDDPSNYVNVLDVQKLYLSWIPLKCSNELIELSQTAQNAMQYTIAGILLLRSFNKLDPENPTQYKKYIEYAPNAIINDSIDCNAGITDHIFDTHKLAFIRAKLFTQARTEDTFEWSLEHILINYCTDDFFVGYNGQPSPAQHLLLELSVHTNQYLTRACEDVDIKKALSTVSLHIPKNNRLSDKDTLQRFERSYIAVKYALKALITTHKMSLDQFVELQSFAISKKIYAMYPIAHSLVDTCHDVFGDEEAFLTTDTLMYNNLGGEIEHILDKPYL